MDEHNPGRGEYHAQFHALFQSIKETQLDIVALRRDIQGGRSYDLGLFIIAVLLTLILWRVW